MNKDGTQVTAKSHKKGSLFGGLKTATEGQIAGDQLRELAASSPKATMVLPVLDILPPYVGSLRPHLISHVIDLAISIAHFELLQSITLDSKLRMIAGRQRRAAVICMCYVADPEVYTAAFNDLWAGDPTVANEAVALHLRSETADAPVLPAIRAWYAANRGGVPVRILPFDSADAGERSRLSEVIENEKRKPFTPQQIRSFAEEMRVNGYRDLPGRPKAGQQSLKVALATVLGVSYSTVRRVLAPEEKPALAPAKAAAVITKRRSQAVVKALSDYLQEADLPAKQRAAVQALLDQFQASPAAKRA